MISDTLKPIVKTNKAIITSQYALYKNAGPYLLPNDFNEIPQNLQIKILYRRFFRLRPFVSTKEMIQSSYTNYIRNKFRENYALKRKIALGIDEPPSIDKDINSGVKTLAFVTKAVSLVDTKNNNGILEDNAICHKLLKNILSVEYHRSVQFKLPREYQILRISYEYLNSNFKRLEYKSLRNNDISIIQLNELLGTRL
ncbi:HFR040Wp [Eremothecium sinecaudum]|uniref:HFR040Wp n=1 Tax=Eremothecium sinecaudum TaxID=45286 RepID=A0A0X8HUU1_9SACH|nr:HFR040Wp [Eremothecium sinecaudum]AMD21895.1 HFR040Wp [Eremothecium sinecaudum]